ncbi:uncharacterized protein MYCFIDRAFT_215041 [Pseudocercospora fijiensis CIRAD86]|uniref:Uncharacterized protein n=1 Tax=Pseudocercospora fijiensis (strain CIRAD86) TaxID=383855 RepID=M2ZUH8_PSEFD|nr:uncharacterized protein MYCFIDRAFT_215041 [Pseudocercospora fijiensis CIRAD86]EME82659.1 hypothetical protein MYCFIDRAFT_215041 [Pseudocercospora fijiensis CIRAD86]
MRSSIQSFHEKLKTWDAPLPDLGLRASLLILRPRLSVNRLSRNERPDEDNHDQRCASLSGVSSPTRSDSIFILHENAAISTSEGINYFDKHDLKESYKLGARDQKVTPPVICKSSTFSDPEQTRDVHTKRSRYSVHSADGRATPVSRSHDDKSVEEEQSAPYANKIRSKSPHLDANEESNPTQQIESTKGAPIPEEESDLSTELRRSEGEKVEEVNHSRSFPPRVSSLAYSKQHAAAVQALQAESGVPLPSAALDKHHPLASDFGPSKNAVPQEARTPQATSKADKTQQKGSESQTSLRGTPAATATQPYSTQSKQLSKQIEKMLTFMTNGHAGAQEGSIGKRTVERTRLLDTHVDSCNTNASSLPGIQQGKASNEDSGFHRLKSKRSFWRIGYALPSATQADKHKSEAIRGYERVNQGGKIDSRGYQSTERDVYDLINKINTIRSDRELKPLEYCERLCAEAQEEATAHDLQTESATLYGATPDLSSGSALWFDDEASKAILVGPTGFDGLTTADIWMQGKEPRHDQRNHKKVVDDAIQLEHCACYNHKMYVALVDELWSRVGMARTETDERWVVVLGEQVAEEDLLPRNVNSKKPAIKRNPLPQNPYAAEYGVMSPYEWDSSEDAEQDTVAGSSRPH